MAALRTAPDSAPAAAAAAAGLLRLCALPALTVAAFVAGILLLGLACDVVRLRRVKRGAVPLGSVPVRGARIGLSRTVTSPTAIGYLHPAVVLPEGFRARVDDREWDAVVAHECAHLARGDDWAKAIQSAVLRAGWWIPGLWVLSRALDLERELASDERAACETGPRRYAACLLRLATDRADALAPALWARRSHVAIRVERLLRPATQGGPAVRAAALGAFTAAAFGVVAGAVLAVPGTGARVATGVPQRVHAAVAHAAGRHAVARVANRVRPLKVTLHPKTLAYSVPSRSAPSRTPGPNRRRAASAAAASSASGRSSAPPRRSRSSPRTASAAPASARCARRTTSPRRRSRRPASPLRPPARAPRRSWPTIPPPAPSTWARA
jgi:bla regulator protein blaR1